MNLFNNITTYDSMNFMIGMTSLFLMLTSWRLARIRRDDNARLETVILTSEQWMAFTLFALFNTLAYTVEFCAQFFTIPAVGVIINSLFALGYVALFDTGRIFFKKYIGRWIYLFFGVAFFYFVMNADAPTFRLFARVGLLLPAAIIMPLAVLMRLRNLNLLCVQMRGASILLLSQGVILSVLGVEMFSIYEAPSLFAILNTYHFPLSIISLALFVVMTILIIDHFGFVRDRFMTMKIKTKRARLRHIILALVGWGIVTGAVSADIASEFAQTHAMSFINGVAKRTILDFDIKNRRQFVEQNLPFLAHITPEVNQVFLFEKNRDGEWESVQSKIPSSEIFERYFKEISRNIEPQFVEVPDNNHAITLYLHPIPPTQNKDVDQILLFELNNSEIASHGNSVRLKILFGSLVFCVLLVLFWQLYATGEDRRVLVNSNLQQFNQLFKESQSVELLLDPRTGSIVDANTYADTFFLCGRGELRQKNITDLPIKPVEINQDTEKLATVDNEGIFLFAPEGQAPRYIEMRSWPIHFLGEDLTFCIISDITHYMHETDALKARIQELENKLLSYTQPSTIRSPK